MKENKKSRLEKVCKFVNEKLNNDNIINASVEDNMLVLDINQSKNYYTLSEPIDELYGGEILKEGTVKKIYTIDSEDFLFYGCENFNTIIYKINLELAY
nr:hypothetical protein [[Eubacterium] tenue]